MVRMVHRHAPQLPRALLGRPRMCREAGGGANAVDLSCIVSLFLPVSLPCIGRMVVDAGSRGSWSFGLVVFDLTERMQQLLQANEGVAGMGGHHQGRIACEAHQGILARRADATLRRCD